MPSLRLRARIPNAISYRSKSKRRVFAPFLRFRSVSFKKRFRAMVFDAVSPVPCVVRSTIRVTHREYSFSNVTRREVTSKAAGSGSTQFIQSPGNEFRIMPVSNAFRIRFPVNRTSSTLPRLPRSRPEVRRRVLGPIARSTCERKLSRAYDGYVNTRQEKKREIYR